MGGAGRGNMVVGVGMGGTHGAGRGDGGQYEMFDVDEGSQSGHSGSGGPSPVGTGYDDAPSDDFEDPGKGSDLAFGDRLY